MSEKKFKKTFVQVNPVSPPVEGLSIPIKESTERWSELELDDGAIIRVKTVVIAAVRVDSQRDADGHPVYIVKSAPVVAVLKGPENQP